MKRIFSLILIFALVIALVGCANGEAPDGGNENDGAVENGDAYDRWVEAIAGDTLQPIHLNEEQIGKMENNIKNLANIEGSLVKVCQIQASGVFAYVIECEIEADTLKIRDERSAVGMYTQISGKTVVYGNNEDIKELE